VLAALILLGKEDAGLTVAPYSLYWWWRWREARPHAYALAGLAVGLTALSLFVVLPGHSPTGELIYTGRYLSGASLVTLSRGCYPAPSRWLRPGSSSSVCRSHSPTSSLLTLISTRSCGITRPTCSACSPWPSPSAPPVGSPMQTVCSASSG